MTIKAMKQALEALEKSCPAIPRDFPAHGEAITTLRTAIEEAEKVEPWNPNDTANRIGGLPQEFIKHEVENEGDWTEWVNPNADQYFMKCCDCGLVHEMQFKVVKYSEGDDCEFVVDANLQAVFRARGVTPPAATVQEPPPECQTEAEKRAYAFGWWKAMEYVRQNGVIK
jgi:hypothetical protein